MKKILLPLFFASLLVVVLSTSCKKSDDDCTIPTTPIPTANTPVEIYDTLYLRLDTTGISNYTFEWSGPDSFRSTATFPKIDRVLPIKSGTYKVKVTDPVTRCTSLEGTIDVVVKSPTTCTANPTVIFSGKTYNTVQLATQCWLKENLDAGTYVESTSSSFQHSDASNNGLVEKYCYNNDLSKCVTYGGLYDWNEMMQYVTTEGSKGVCPTGWHIPSKADWQKLITGIKDGSSLGGTKLKEGGASGFEGLLSGFRYPTGSSYSIGDYADFWSSTVEGTNVWHLKIRLGDATAVMSTSDKRYGLSVRCVQD